MIRVVSPSAALPFIEKQAAALRRWKIEYGKYLSNHVVWIVVPLARLGLENKAQEFAADYAAAKLEENVGLEGAKPASDPVALANDRGEHYNELLAFFDGEVEKATQGTTTFEDSQRALSRVVATHLPPVSAGLGAAALHPILHLGVGLETGSPLYVAEGLAYLYSRTWKEYDTGFKITDTPKQHPLVELLSWTEEVTANHDEMLNKSYEYSTTKEYEDRHIGAFQSRVLPWVREEELKQSLLKHELYIPGDRRDLLNMLYDLFVIAAAGTLASNNEFFMLHGLTSIWSVTNIVELTPDLPIDDARHLVAAWLRAYITVYAAQGLPSSSEVSDVVKAVAGGDSNAVVQAVAEIAKSDEPPLEVGEGWDTIIAGAAERTRADDEHIVKGVWMMHLMWLKLTATDCEIPAKEMAPVLWYASRRLGLGDTTHILTLPKIRASRA